MCACCQGQVNEILAGAGRAEAEGGSPVVEVLESEPDPVRRATLQQLRAAGVSLAPSQPDHR